jgi:hypothetical protein
MALVPHRRSKGQVTNASFASASRHGIATLGSASEEETKLKQPPGPRLQNNHLSNPLWDADSAYPAAQNSHGRDKSSLNGQGSQWLDNYTPESWKRYCPLYTAPYANDFQTILNNYFLRARKKDNLYQDLAAEHTSSDPEVSIVGDRYMIGPNQPRILGLYGASGHLSNRNNDADRAYGDLVLYGQANGAIDSSTTHSEGKGWVKHSYYQHVAIPTNATKIQYGAYVQCPSFDSFDTNNFAAIQVSQCTAKGNTSTSVYGDGVFIKNNADTIPSPAISASGNQAQYLWNGPTARKVPMNVNMVYPGDFRWPGSITTSGTTLTAEDYRDFKLITRQQPQDLQARTGSDVTALSSILFELIFFENSANIASATGSTGSGSVRFYAPYIQFLDSSYNVISP